jgi:DNA-binding NarL/FixJ family response regulator
MSKSSYPAKSEIPKRILIVEDHPLVRFGLTNVLNRSGRYTVCGEAEDHFEALLKIRELNPDLVTVDLKLKRTLGLELIKDIHAHFPTLRVLVVSMYDELLNVRRIIGAGAHGYITKLESPARIITALDRIFAGGVYVSHEVTSQMALQLAGQDPDRPAPGIHNLTDRELEIFELTGEGLNARQIAAHLNLGFSTIETYRNRIKAKLHFSDRSQMLQTAIRWNHGRSLTGNPAAGLREAS